MTIDAHQHFWDPQRAHYPWMAEAPAVLRNRFGPDHLEPLAESVGIDHTIVVQARSDLFETRELLATAHRTPLVLAAVAWVDLTDPDLQAVLAELVEGPDGNRLVGIRHQVEDEPDLGWLLRPDVHRGLEVVSESGLAFDLLVRTPHLEAALETVRSHAEVRFVVDHIGKPPIKTGEMEPWAERLAAVASHENVWCKLSGMLAEADWDHWKPLDLAPYVERVIDMFGVDRLLYGSDWPVCLVAASYEEAFDATMHTLSQLSDDERAKIFGGNAVEAYRLQDLVRSTGHVQDSR